MERREGLPTQSRGRLGGELRGQTGRGRRGALPPGLEAPRILLLGGSRPALRVGAKTLRVSGHGARAEQVAPPGDPQLRILLLETPQPHRGVEAPGAQVVRVGDQLYTLHARHATTGQRTGAAEALP